MRGVHNALYVYAPNAPFSSAEDYLDRYPGDAYVDVFGFDFYDDDDDTPAFMERLEHAAALAASAAGSRSRAMTIRIGRVRRQPSRGVIISRIS